MKNQKTLLAKLFSLEAAPSLPLFLQIMEHLDKGESLSSAVLWGQFPALTHILKKYSQKDLRRWEGALEASETKGFVLLYPGHKFYPEQFFMMSDPPFLLRMLGSPAWYQQQGLSVVGSREPGTLSCQWMDEQLSLFLSDNDCFTVSGGARGVDQKIHALSIRYGRPTVVLVPSGLDRLYPPGLAEWKEDILKEGGAFLSEYEDDVPMRKDFFHQRNRLISALGCLTLIVEARLRSGTMITARYASEQQRLVMVLPGHPYDFQFAGSLELLRDGATMASDACFLAMTFAHEVQSLTYMQRELRSSLVSNQSWHH